MFGLGLLFLTPFTPKLEKLLRGFLAIFDFGKFPQEFFLALIEIFRCLNVNVNVKISPAITSQIGNSLSAQADYFTALSARRNLQTLATIKRLDFDGIAKRRLNHGDRDLTVKMVAISFIKLVRLDVQPDVKVSGWTSSIATLTLIGNAETGAGVNPSWHLDQHFLRNLLLSSSGTGLAWIRNNPSLAAAAMAGRAYSKKSL